MCVKRQHGNRQAFAERKNSLSCLRVAAQIIQNDRHFGASIGVPRRPAWWLFFFSEDGFFQRMKFRGEIVAACRQNQQRPNAKTKEKEQISCCPGLIAAHAGLKRPSFRESSLFAEPFAIPGHPKREASEKVTHRFQE